MEPVFCKHCERWLPLTKEFWTKDKSQKSGFAMDRCKECRRGDYAERFKSYRKEKKVEKEQFESEHFGSFESKAQAERLVNATGATISIYQEIP